MAWNRRPGGGRGSNNQGPWGQPPSGGGQGGGSGGPGSPPPDLEELFRRSQDRLKHAFPGGLGGGFMVLFIVLALAVIWGISGFYRVGADEQGVVLQFGKYSRTVQPGLHWHVPWPVETVETPKVTRVFCEAVGTSIEQEGCTARRVSADDRLMLTGDRNFLEVEFSVYWQINDAKKFLFNIVRPQSDSVISVVESAMREVVGRGDFDALQTAQRAATEVEVLALAQSVLDSYGAGVTITEIKLQTVDPPADALAAARRVETAKQEKEKLRNQAEAYQNRIIPEARGQAERMNQEALAYKQRVIAEAQGEGQRFVSVYDQYRKAPEVTRKRMHLETMERLFGGMNKVIIDQSSGGVVPYLPLPELQKRDSATGGK